MEIRRPESGITLIEMMIVVVIISLIAAVSAPALTSGLSSVRLSTASGSVASFLTSTMNNVDRREQPVALEIDPKENHIAVFTARSGKVPERQLHMPAGITIEGDGLNRMILMPGGVVPRITVLLRNDKGSRRSIQIDPVTGVPLIQRVTEAK